MHNIPFNKSCFEGKEPVYIANAINQHISGDVFFSRKCSENLKTAMGCKKVLLTTSCTPAMDSKWQGKKLGQEMIIQSLRYLYEAGVRHAETKISASNLAALNMHSRLQGRFIMTETLALASNGIITGTRHE